ncbi:bis(5'-nucleosyl)-tetraphosphatase (symmetrical) YqeK [Crassaminicella profunda]|uniref:bis(5'-nucleosyl)-tetraphosphatase (symmetrical) YqeK n=1 Tax=Crassaminicella profunda TaxID=1286698 RepID=UPI001CA69FB1|nr:bis(5'-nucleosyl)-tetraphosphatase (symmetrical) YqeK [Crassaminicella profunda]QZY57080.1 bis(5'-nucleosyl)-tetraphosphatase (symmetrical) YqeK [Crassaminicella profunda]
MLQINEIKKILKSKLKEKRYLHSLGVQKTAENLAKIHNGPVTEASIAGLVHDCAKNLSNEELLNYAKQFGILIDGVTKFQPGLLHGAVGAEVAKREFFIEDDEILNAIHFHTTGKENMTLLEKIIYLADYIEPNRNFNGVEILREVALSDLDKAILMAFNNTIKYVVIKGELLHPTTILARNYLLLQRDGLRQE